MVPGHWQGRRVGGRSGRLVRAGSSGRGGVPVTGARDGRGGGATPFPGPGARRQRSRVPAPMGSILAKGPQPRKAESCVPAEIPSTDVAVLPQAALRDPDPTRPPGPPLSCAPLGLLARDSVLKALVTPEVRGVGRRPLFPHPPRPADESDPLSIPVFPCPSPATGGGRRAPGSHCDSTPARSWPTRISSSRRREATQTCQEPPLWSSFAGGAGGAWTQRGSLG